MTNALVDYLQACGCTHEQINAISNILLKAGARDPVIVWKCLDTTKIQLNSDGTVPGVEEQVEALQERAPYMFKSPATSVEPEVCSDADAFYTLINWGGEWSQLGGYAPPNVRTPVPKRVAFQTAQAHVNKKVVDGIQRRNWFFRNLLPLQEITNVVIGDAAAVYRYHRKDNLPSANSEVTETETLEATIANLAIALNVDVDLIRLGGAVNLLNGVLDSSARGISNIFNEMVIRGDSAIPNDPKNPAAGPASFDGLDKIIRKESQHVWDEPLDLTGLGDINVMSGVTDQLMFRIHQLHPSPTFILGNSGLIIALSLLGGAAGMYTAGKDEFDHIVESISGVKLVSMGWRNGQYGKDIIPTEKVKVDDLPPDQKPRNSPDGYAYVTKAYVGSFGPNAVQGLMLPGGLVEVRPPENLNIGDWIKTWRVGMHIGMAVMSRHACGMFTNIYLPKKCCAFK